MQYIRRKLDLEPLVAEKSCFLIDPRQTGKSSYLAAISMMVEGKQARHCRTISAEQPCLISLCSGLQMETLKKILRNGPFKTTVPP